jgi:hypothetical protein
MEQCNMFSASHLARLRRTCRAEPRLVALYAFDPEGTGDCQLTTLFTEPPPWRERLDLELAVAEALEAEGIELTEMRRMPLVSRFDVLKRGDLLFVGNPDALAIFVEETVVRYSAFYPLLEALYWKVHTRPLVEDQVWQETG